MAQTQVHAHAISVVDLLKRFEDVTAVDGLSFDVESGEIFGLLGPKERASRPILISSTGCWSPPAARPLFWDTTFAGSPYR